MRRGFFGEDVNKSMKCFNGPPHSPPTHHAKNHLFSMLSVIRELKVVPNTEQLHSKIGCKTFPFLDQTETQGSYNRSSPERVNKPFATCNSSWEAARRSAANNVLLRRLSFLFFPTIVAVQTVLIIVVLEIYRYPRLTESAKENEKT